MAEATNGRSRKGITIFITLLIIVALGIFAAVWLLPRLLGANDETIADIMPEETAVFLELDLLNMQNSETGQLISAWKARYDEVDIPLSNDDPTSLLNVLDTPLKELVGLTISEDVQPWIGTNVGLGLLPATGNTPLRWVIVATIRDSDEADAFVEKLSAALAGQNGLQLDDITYQPVVSRERNHLIIASDEETHASLTSNREGPSLADSNSYQQMLAELPGTRAFTLYGEGAVLLEWLPTVLPEENAGVMEAVLGILPQYTAVGLAGQAVAEGIQVDMIGFHETLNETQEAWLAAQTATSQLDNSLPEDTAVFLRGRRLDLLWQQLKGSLDGLGYSEADIDEALQLFSDLFEFNPDTDLLALLDEEFVLSLVPVDPETSDNQLGPGLSVVALAQHPNPDQLADQAKRLVAGLATLDRGAASGNSYQIKDANGNDLVAYTVHNGNLLVGLDDAGITAVTQNNSPLRENLNYQTALAALPEESIPMLFINGTQLAEQLANGSLNPPFAYAILGTNSDLETSRSIMIFFTTPLKE